MGKLQTSNSPKASFHRECALEKRSLLAAPRFAQCAWGELHWTEPEEHKLPVPSAWPLDEDLGTLCNLYQIQIQRKLPTQLITPGPQSQDFPFAPKAERQIWAASNPGSFLAATRILRNSASPILAAPSLTQSPPPALFLPLDPPTA